ncbi:hypothetical protein KCP73_14450 [Salmonella enterica subsp. enterica]|nr:hypothetical protein KCP73_14450 [Salmonella enterica subsp. enterica]
MRRPASRSARIGGCGRSALQMSDGGKSVDKYGDVAAYHGPWSQYVSQRLRGSGIKTLPWRRSIAGSRHQCCRGFI